MSFYLEREQLILQSKDRVLIDKCQSTLAGKASSFIQLVSYQVKSVPVTPLWSIGCLLTVFPAIALTYFHILPTVYATYCVVLLQLVLDLHLLHCPWWGVLTESLFVYGRGILCHCVSDPLPFPQFDLHCHLFLLYSRIPV